ncbi:MAG: glycosyl transferase [Pseudonocardia sp.]|nr:glycosyl transferase [Pseudonocardia sp.]
MDRHLALVSLPAHGHVNPTLPVVAELVRRGWRVSYVTAERFGPEVEKTGATLVPTAGRAPGGPGPGRLTPAAFAGFIERITADARDSLPGVREHFRVDPPQAVCYDAMSITGRVLAATAGAVDVALVPSFVSNERSSAFARGGTPPPEILAAVQDMRALLASYGLDAQMRPGMLAPASLNIVFVPPEFQPGADTFDDRYRFVGPSPSARADDGEWTPPNEPVVFVSLGTAFNDRPEFFRACFAAFGGGRPVAMAVGERVRPEHVRRADAVRRGLFGWSIADLGAVPANVDVRPWFPQPAVLRHAAAFVSHAGMGSTMEALYYGVPLVCVPQMAEQEVNAARVAELGLGVRLDPEGLTADDLRAAVDAVTSDAAMRVALDRMRTATRSAGGAVAAADAIEAHLAA